MGKPRAGFKINYTYGGSCEPEIVIVSFKNYNNKAIECIITNKEFEKTVKGKSRCHPNDEFNEIEGRKWAFERALAKYKKFMDSNCKFISLLRDYRLISSELITDKFIRLEKSEKLKCRVKRNGRKR